LSLRLRGRGRSDRACSPSPRTALSLRDGRSARFSPDSQAPQSVWSDDEIDRKLLELRQRLEKEAGTQIDFYEGELRNRWQRKPEIRSWLLSWNPERWRWESLAAARQSRDGKFGDRSLELCLGPGQRGRSSLLNTRWHTAQRHRRAWHCAEGTLRGTPLRSDEGTGRRNGLRR
jgi:hypothetical protein